MGRKGSIAAGAVGLLALASATFTFAGCSEAPPAPAMPLAQFCGDGNKPPLGGDKKPARAQVEGYVQMPSLFVMCDTTCLFMVTQDREGKGARVGASFRVGSSDGHLERPTNNFTASDVKLHAREGKLVDLTKPVKISGHRIGQDEKSCVMVVDRIEQ